MAMIAMSLLALNHNALFHNHPTLVTTKAPSFESEVQVITAIMAHS